MGVAKTKSIAIVLLLLVVGLSCLAIYLDHATLVVAKALDPYAERTYADSSGRGIVAVEVAGKPPDTKSPAADAPTPDIAAGINVLSNVPAFEWSYGCSPTSAAMLFGYYDRTGYSNMYAGPTNGGVCPLDNSIWGYTVYPSVTCYECPLSATHQGTDNRASKGHVDDYWIDYGNSGPDPYISGGWTEHTQGDCTGDFMGTNQSKFGNVDGGTMFGYYANGDPFYDYAGSASIRDGCHGMRLFAESRGYSVETDFTQLIQGQGTDPAKGFTFAQYCAEIDAGRPVLIQVTNHTMLGYGYNTTGSVVYLHDTWDHLIHTMTWGGSYSGLQQLGVTVIQLSPATITVKTSGLVPSNPATVHYVQAGVPETATIDGIWSDNVDYGSTLSIDNTVAVSSTKRYSTTDTTSWTVTQAATYSVNYATQDYLTVQSERGNPEGTGWYDQGSTVQFYVDSIVNETDGIRYVFNGWSGDSTQIDNTSSLVMTSPKTVIANWKLQYFLTIHSDQGNAQGVGWYDSGTTAQFSVPSLVDQGDGTGYAFNGWSGDSTQIDNTSSLVMTSPKTVTANWKEQCELTVTIVPPGVTAGVGAGWYDKGTTATISMPDVIGAGTGIQYVFSGWEVDGGRVAGNSISVEMYSHHSALAKYTLQYYLTIQSDMGTPQGIGWYTSGTQASISVTSPLGAIVRHVFTGWSGDSSGTSAATTISMDSPKSVIANWRTDYTQLYILIGGILAVGMLATCTILLLRKRSKAGTH